MIETKNQINGTYKGYIYCNGLDEAKNLTKTVNDEM